MSNTPSYQGLSQAAGSGGLLGRIGSFFGGGGTPAYLGEGRPSTGSGGGLLGVGTPAYRAAPVVTPPKVESTSTQTVATARATGAPTSYEEGAQERAQCEAAAAEESIEPARMAHAVLACRIEPDPLGSGPIAIVIPRQG